MSVGQALLMMCLYISLLTSGLGLHIIIYIYIWLYMAIYIGHALHGVYVELCVGGDSIPLAISTVWGGWTVYH